MLDFKFKINTKDKESYKNSTTLREQREDTRKSPGITIRKTRNLIRIVSFCLRLLFNFDFKHLLKASVPMTRLTLRYLFKSTTRIKAKTQPSISTVQIFNEEVAPKNHDSYVTEDDGARLEVTKLNDETTTNKIETKDQDIKRLFGELAKASSTQELKSKSNILQISIDNIFQKLSNDLRIISYKPTKKRKNAFNKVQKQHADLINLLNEALYSQTQGHMRFDVRDVIHQVIKKASNAVDRYTQEVSDIVILKKSFPKSFTCFSSILDHQLCFSEWVMRYGSVQESNHSIKQLSQWIKRIADPNLKSWYFFNFHIVMAQAAFSRGNSNDNLKTNISQQCEQLSKAHLLSALSLIEKQKDIPLHTVDISFILTQACVWLDRGDYALSDRLYVMGTALIEILRRNVPRHFPSLVTLSKTQKTTKTELCDIVSKRLRYLQSEDTLNFPVFYKDFKFLENLDPSKVNMFKQIYFGKQKVYWDALKDICRQYDLKPQGKTNSLVIQMEPQVFKRLHFYFSEKLTSLGLNFKKETSSSCFRLKNINTCSLADLKKALQYFDNKQGELENILERVKFKNNFNRVIADLSGQMFDANIDQQEDSSDVEDFIMSYTPNSPTMTGFKMRQALSAHTTKVKTTGNAAPPPQVIINNASVHDPVYGFNPKKYGALLINQVRTRGALAKPFYVALDNRNYKDECDAGIRQEFSDHLFAQPKMCKPTGESGFKWTKDNRLMAKHKSYPFRAFPTDIAVNKEGECLYVYSSITNPKKGKNKYG